MLAGEKLVDGAAILEYRWISDGVAELFHTEVPTSYRGKGIAKILAKVTYLLVDGFRVQSRGDQMVAYCTALPTLRDVGQWLVESYGSHY